ncbi:MAG: ATP-binding protein [Candidatus Rokubacteria bacterium]|nr:ATP-binding protein [Candidatus Rokubacteria bacterium]
MPVTGSAGGHRTYAEALRLAELILVARWPAVLDGSFSRAVEREEARRLAGRLGVSLTVLWCDAPDDAIAGRLAERAADPHEVSDGRPELLAAHRARYEPPLAEAGVVRIDTAGDPGGALARLGHDP